MFSQKLNLLTNSFLWIIKNKMYFLREVFSNNSEAMNILSIKIWPSQEKMMTAMKTTFFKNVWRISKAISRCVFCPPPSQTWSLSGWRHHKIEINIQIFVEYKPKARVKKDFGKWYEYTFKLNTKSKQQILFSNPLTNR